MALLFRRGAVVPHNRPSVPASLALHRPVTRPRTRLYSAYEDVQNISGSVYKDVGSDEEPTPAFDSTLDIAQRRSYVMQDLVTTLGNDLRTMFDTGAITVSKYSQNVTFRDPITVITGIDLYIMLIRALKVFSTKLDLHTIQQTGDDEITARWSMDMTAWMLPWQPVISFTGTSIYKVDTDLGLVVTHTDTWDAIKHQSFISLEGLIFVLRQALTVQLTPQLESLRFSLLKKTADYELRKQEPYVVAATPMGPASGPASGVGFNQLASYIFGNNEAQVQMDMTTPVLSRVESQQQGAVMEFLMGSRYTGPDQLPKPLNSSVSVQRVEGSYVAVARFSGFPLDHETVAAEQALRSALIRDGLYPRPGYRLARYNEPTVPPFLRRNEIIIELDDFSWPQ